MEREGGWRGAAFHLLADDDEEVFLEGGRGRARQQKHWESSGSSAGRVLNEADVLLAAHAGSRVSGRGADGVVGWVDRVGGQMPPLGV